VVAQKSGNTVLVVCEKSRTGVHTDVSLLLNLCFEIGLLAQLVLDHWLISSRAIADFGPTKMAFFEKHSYSMEFKLFVCIFSMIRMEKGVEQSLA